MLFAANTFVSTNLSREFADPPAFNLKAIYETSSVYTPLIFVLSPGVDPTAQVTQLADEVLTHALADALAQPPPGVSNLLL